MIKITGNDISELNDIDLRSLIGLLCEADLSSKGLPTAGVTWGGHQNAKDGGIDVRVELATTLHKDSFVPRSKTGFQVKKPDMPRAAIIDEMRPKGMLRQVIKDLIDANGAYIIVSSQGSTSDSSLRARKDAMREALSDYPNASNLKVDFYDRERIAGWVRSHPAISIWVMEKIGRPIQGWKSYGNWANNPDGIADEYLLDEHVRLYNNSNPNFEGVPAVTGINEIRTILRNPGSSVRLTGLSGVGKTRLLQALFDERIGSCPLSKSQVFYCDVGDSPNPNPRSFAERIIALQKPLILAIDNCSPDLHRRLTSVCSAPNSLVSLITVEYDVREDQPEETKVFRLEPSSHELIEKMIQARFSHISQVDARTIAEFSGGNARIAIALGNTVQRGENLGKLTDSELFNRLFQQRNEPNISLLRVAEACSLVYSFDSQTDRGANTELKLIGSLIDMSVRENYANVSELKRRDLVQQRSIWRAVLPHAIANRLAQRAFENIPLNDICSVFEKGGSERLLKSFSRRINYLHECKEVMEIASRWLTENDLLGDVGNLNELGISLFKNIAPINPEATLSAIERASNRSDNQNFMTRKNVYYTDFTRLLRSLSYDKELFERSIELLCRFALSENPKENINSIRRLLKSLFYIYLSGTHATPEQRLFVIKRLIESESEDEIDLGIYLLDASLETWHFSSSYDFKFGARSRDHGYVPKSKEDIQHWFKLFIKYAVTIIVSNFPAAPKAKALLAEKFRGLWVKAGMCDELEAASKKISVTDTWKEGWLAVKTTIRFDGQKMNPKDFSRLNELDAILKPSTLIERARLYALVPPRNTLSLVDIVENENKNTSDCYLQVQKTTRSLGRDVAFNEEIFKEILPDILINEGHMLFIFGQGLADGCDNPKVMWIDFCKQLSLIEESKRSYNVLGGFLNAINEIEPTLSEKFLNEAVTDNILAIIFPWLQNCIKIDAEGVGRLMQSIEFGMAPIWRYGCLATGRIHENISEDKFCELIRLISAQEEGMSVAIEILSMSINGYLEKGALSDTIANIGQELVLKYEYNLSSQMDYALSEIIKACFVNDASKENAKVLCSKLLKAFSNYDILSIDYGDVLEAIVTRQPITFLDIFLGDDAKINGMRKMLFSSYFEICSNPISNIDDKLIINWCEVNPESRYPIIASAIKPHQNSKNNNLLEWTPLALKIIDNSSDPIIILNKFSFTFKPMSWSGSRADIMEKHLSLISYLKNHEDSSIVEWAYNEEKIFEEEIQSERELELKREIYRNERFE